MGKKKKGTIIAWKTLVLSKCVQCGERKKKIHENVSSEEEGREARWLLFPENISPVSLNLPQGRPWKCSG